MVGARPRFRALSGGGRAAGGGPPTSRRGARSAQVSLAGSVGPSPSTRPRLPLVFRAETSKDKSKA
ncbi:MAG: hypothetical protein QOD62_507 [Actinomycetota bacterium]|nr:hypothetical protein [Actinomycetota bacterium]